MTEPEFKVWRDPVCDNYEVTVRLGNREIKRIVTNRDLMINPSGYVSVVVDEMILKLMEGSSGDSGGS